MVEKMVRVESAALHWAGLITQLFRDIGSVRQSFRGYSGDREFRNQMSVLLVFSFIIHVLSTV